ncbi:MAG: flippase [bacterium]|nr:flippase [bacterium]
MSEILKSVAKNTILQIGGKIISTTLGILITILLTHYLGRAGYGQYTFVLVFVTIFGVIGDWGFSLITIREASRNLEEAGKIIGNVLVIRLILALIAMVASIVVINILPYSQTIRLLVTIGSVYLLAVSLKTSFQIVFNVKLKLQNWAISEIAANSIALFLILFLIINKAGLPQILWAFNIAHLFAAGVAAILARKLLNVRFAFKIPQTRSLLWESLPMGAILVLFTVYNRMDVLILGHFHGDEAVGIYGVAYKIFEVLVLGAAYFANSLLPTISRLAVENKPELAKLFKRSLIILMLMGTGVAIVNYIFAPVGVAVFGWSEFAPAVTPLRILSLSLIVSYFNHLGGFTLIALGKQWTSFKIAIIALGVNFILNLWLIPRFSYNAAAFTTFLTEGLIVIITVFVIRHELNN